MSAFAFDGDVAAVIGINAALILQHLHYWVERNRANNKHEIDGEFWTYNSRKAFQAIFPFLTDNQIRGALNKLESEGYIKTGEYNEDKYDRTKWYTVTDKGVMLLEGEPEVMLQEDEKSAPKTPENLGQINCSAGEKNQMTGENHQPIPDINHIYTPQYTSYTTPQGGKSEKEGAMLPDAQPQLQTLADRFAIFWSAYPRKVGKGAALKVWNRLRPSVELLDQMLTAISWQKQLRQWQEDGGKFIPHPSTWLNAGRWEDEKPPELRRKPEREVLL